MNAFQSWHLLGRMNNETEINSRNKIILIVISLLIIIYIIYAIYNLIMIPTETFIVKNGRISSEESVQGYIIRDETVLKGENYKNGIAQIKSEGEKVAKGEPIFRYYTNGEDSLVEKIQELDIKIQEAWESENNSLFTGDIKILEQQIESKLDEMYHITDMQKMAEYKKDLNTYITKKAKIAGEQSPSGSYLKKLIEERSNYENQLNSGAEYITATRSGVISYRVDGLEEILTTEQFGALSKTVLEDLKLKTGQIISSSEESGKIIDNFSCYIACIIKKKNVEEKEVQIGTELTLRLSNNEEVKAEISYISQETNEECLVVFKVDRCVEELINYRKISLDIIWWNVSGWKVPNESIKYENEDLAYVIREKLGYTDKIYVKVLKKGEKYSIIENYERQELLDKGITEEDSSFGKSLRMYDEVQL